MPFNREAYRRNTEGMDYLSNGPCPGCSECEITREQWEEQSIEYRLKAEAWFSWKACNLCETRLGGDRELFHYRDRDDTLCHSDCCVTCIYFMAYGELPDGEE